MSQLKADIVYPALVAIGLAEPARVAAVTGTAGVESGFGLRVRQLGGGPAVSAWQIEPVTAAYLVNGFLPALPYRSHVQAAFLRMRSQEPLMTQLVADMRLAAALCAIKYWSAPQSLPPLDAAALCYFWKVAYNSSGGAGVVDPASVALFGQAIAA